MSEPSNERKALPPFPATAPAKPGRKTLAAVIGTVAGAAALFAMVPAEESGRQVKTEVVGDEIKVTHVRGNQHLDAYLDIVKIPTICDGDTKGVKMGMRETPEGCARRLEAQLIAHAEPVVGCVPGLKGRTNQVVAMVSLAYNVGVGAVCKSTAAKLFNAGRWREGCAAMLRFNKAGGRVVAGLDNRRRREYAVCIRGL
jgi:GH24 family phage-related lysozyme (muramidase)